MRIPTTFASLSAAALICTVVLSGCNSTAAAPKTVLVTETASTDADPGTASGVTVAPLSTDSGSASVSVSQSPSASASETASETATPSETVAPIVKVDPLKADCSKVLTPAALGPQFGQLPAGTDRITEAANAAREITGRLKCQYGVNDNKTAIAVQVVLAQFTTEFAAQTQMKTTVDSEISNGAKASTTTVQGHPANILLRDGGLLVVGYDTWTLSVVVDSGVVTDDKLPAALEATADYALTHVISGS